MGKKVSNPSIQLKLPNALNRIVEKWQFNWNSNDKRIVILRIIREFDKLKEETIKEEKSI
jgi:hypothetical protein